MVVLANLAKCFNPRALKAQSRVSISEASLSSGRLISVPHSNAKYIDHHELMVSREEE